MRSLTSATWRPSILTYIAPSPSTRASRSVRITRRCLPSLMCLACPPERLGVGVEGAVHAHQVHFVGALLAHLSAQGRGVRSLHRPVAAVAAAIIGRADRTAAGVGDGAEARCAVGDH